MNKDIIKVLLVEDDEDDYKLTSDLLSEIYGDKVAIEWVDNYPIALDKLRERCHDVYLLDYRLGEHSGLDLLKEAEALAIREPIILLTGQGDTESWRDAVRMGAVDYLLKSHINAPLLERAIEYAVQRKEMQHTLQKQAVIFDTIQDGIFFTDMEGRIINWNPASEKITGYSKAEALGKTSAFLHRPEESEEITARIAEGLQREGRWAGEMVYVRKDGTEGVVETIVALVFDEQGLPMGTLSTNRDVTERTRADDALRERTERLAEAQHLARMGSWEWDVRNNVVTWSDEMFRIFGVEPQEFGATFQAYMGYVHPEDRARVGGDIERALQEKSSFNHECRFVQPDGTVKNNHARGETILDGAGNIVRMRGTAQDITERKQSEQELRRSQERFSKAFNASPTAVSITNLITGKFVDVNDSFIDESGYSREELIGHRSIDLGIWADQDARNKVTEMLRMDGSVAQMEIAVRTKSGVIIDVLFSADLIDLEGEQCVLSTIVDITERKKVEEELRLTSEVLARVNSIVFVSNKDAKITYVSPSVKRILGYEPEDLLGDGWWQVSRRNDSEAQQEVSRLSDAARSDDASYWEPYERMVLDQAGELHCILWQDSKGRGDQLIGVGHDITERKRLESEREHLFSVSVDMMCVAGLDGYFKSVNPAFETTLGISSAELLSKPSIEFVHPDDRAATLAQREILATGIATISLDNRYICGDGSYKWLSWNSVCVVEDGLVYAVARDMTERMQAEAAHRAKEVAEAANEAKSEFLSRMSHELRTPLNAIIGFSQLLQMDDLDPDQMESIGLVYKAGRHLLDLINEVLEISSIESGQMSLSSEPVLVADVLRECLNLVKPMAADKNIMLRAGEALRSNTHVQADRQRLKQIILNLLSNAIKYNRVGGSVRLSCEEFASGTVRIGVNDSGAGLAPEKLEKLFTPFERLDAYQTGVEGTGLGLALSKRLAELMDGKTGVESVVGQGSTFWIELPAAASPLKQIEATTTGPLQLDGGQAGKTVLYIEDNASNLRLIQHIFQRWPDIRLLSAMEGTLGFELACKHSPDLILLDLHLPDVHGEQVLEWLRHDPRTRETPVIIISADATSREAERLLGLGADIYITKPIDVKHFVTVVKDTLQED